MALCIWKTQIEKDLKIGFLPFLEYSTIVFVSSLGLPDKTVISGCRCCIKRIMSSPKDRPNYDRDSSSDTEDYHDSEDRRRRVYKNRLRYH